MYITFVGCCRISSLMNIFFEIGKAFVYFLCCELYGCIYFVIGYDIHLSLLLDKGLN